MSYVDMFYGSAGKKDFKSLRTKEKEAALYYLYMMSDGKVSKKEETLFKKLCKELEIDDNSKENIISLCENSDDKDDVLEIIKRENLEEDAIRFFFLSNVDKKKLARLVWNLINLGYADENYSDDEKEIVAYIAEKNSLDKGIVREFTDIADTMLALTKQKKWADSAIENDDEKRMKKKEISREITKLSESIQVIIDEI